MRFEPGPGFEMFLMEIFPSSSDLRASSVTMAPKMWWSVVIMLVGEKAVMSSEESSVTYKILFDGNTKITGSYAEVGAYSVITCAGACSSYPKCYVFTWDTSLQSCSLLDPLTTTFPTGAAPITLRTYVSTTPFGHRVFKTVNSGYWTSVNASCFSQGGRLHIPPHMTASLFYRVLFNVFHYWIGIYRLTVSDPWLDMDGQVYIPNLDWYPGEPNNLPGQYYMAAYHGMLSDVDNNYILFGVCEAVEI
ncbi:hypothetical protein SK128_012608 [Halocaridina rubra]|uniref:C-type lectin domain-containing protein n=1 Tax=Halocaridina rubra TaxID=373956 RepID=A0AAN8XEG4_HALRR